MAEGLELAKAYIQIVPTTTGIKGNLEKELSEAGESAGKEGGKSIALSIGKVAGTITNAAAAGLAAVTTAVVGFGKESVDAGKEFDSAMSQVQATMLKTSEEMDNELGTAVLETSDGVKEFSGNLREFAQFLGSNTAFSATEAAKALNYMALAGYDTQESMNMLPNVLSLAAAGDFDLARASDMVTDTQTAFGISADRTAQMVDEMAKAASTGNTSVEQLGDAFLVVGGLAKELNGGMVTLADGTQTEVDGVQELEIALTAMANAGVKGSEAGTHMRNMLLKLASPTNAGAEAMNMLGLEIFDTEGNMRSLKDIFGDISSAMAGDLTPALTEFYNKFKGMDAEAILKEFKKAPEDFDYFGVSVVDAKGRLKDFDTVLAEAHETFADGLSQDAKLSVISDMFNTRDVAAAEAMLGAIESDWDEIGEAILDAKGSASEMANIQLDNLAGDMTLFQSALEGAKIAVSDGLTPSLRGFVKFGTQGLSDITAAFQEEGLTGAINVFSNLIGEGTRMILEQIPQMVQVGGQIFSAIIDGGMQAMPIIMEQLPAILSLIIDLALQITNGLVGALPDFITMIVAALPVIIPQLLDGVTNLLLTLMGMADQIIMPIIEALPTIVMSLLDALMTNLPLIITGLISLVISLVEAMPEIISGLVEYIPVMVDTLMETLIGNLDAIISGLVALVTALVAALPDILMALWDCIVATFTTLWDYWIGPVVDKVCEFFSGLWEDIKEIFAVVGEWFDANVIQPVVEFFRGLWESVSGFFTDLWNDIVAIWETVSGWFDKNVIQPVVGFFRGVWQAVSGFFTQLWKDIVKAYHTVIDPWIEIFRRAFLLFKEKIVDPVVRFFTAMWNTIKGAAQTAWNFIKGVWQAVSGWFNQHIIIPVRNFFTSLWTGIKNAASAAWNFIKGIWAAVSGWFNSKIITPVKNFFSGMWNGLKNGAKAAWEGIKNVFSHVSDWFKNVFSNAWQKVKDVFSKGGQVFAGIKDGIVSAFKAVVNAIITGINAVIAVPFNAINAVLQGIHDISILGIQPFTWINPFAVPQIPLLAEGGIITSPRLLVAGEAGAEAIVPLDQSTQWIRKVAADLSGELSGDSLQEIADEVAEISEKLDRLKVYLDSGRLVGGISVDMEKSLEYNRTILERGVALA